MGTVERLANWAAELSIGDVPEPVLALCRAQRASVLGAVAASAGDGAARRVLRGLEAWGAEGAVPLPGSGRRLRAEDALYGAAALSIALDFDDYVCFAHTGHSAVLVPLVLAAETGASGSEQLVAQVVANEVGGRLGGACLLGPLNGQLWSFVHAAGAALAAGRLLGLDARQLAHALALALYQAPRPTVPGFMGPDSKLLTAAEPAVLGLRAARLAAAGVSGPLDVLDDRRGFFEAFSYAPLPALLQHLGSGWVTSTLSVKRYPGCAYVDTAVDALLELGPIESQEIAALEVDAGMLSCEMDAMARRHASPVGPPTPVTVTFSLPWTLAVTALAGQLTPAQTHDAWLEHHADELSRLVEAVAVHHDWRSTGATAAAMAPLLPPGPLLAGARPGRVLSALRRLRHEHEPLRLGPGEALGLLRMMRADGKNSWGEMARSAELWRPEALESFRMTFPARVRLRLSDGRVLAAAVDVPAGGAGRVDLPPALVAREKLRTYGPLMWGTSGTDRLVQAIDDDAEDLSSLVGATPTAEHASGVAGALRDAAHD